MQGIDQYFNSQKVLSYLKSENFFLIFLVALNFCLKVFRLDSPSFSYIDEKNFYVPAAKSILTTGIDTVFQHPPLGKIIIALGIKVFGDNPWGWRLLPVFFSIVACLATYFLAKKMFGGRFIPSVASIFITFETAWFIHSRVALIEIFFATFIILGFYYFWVFLDQFKYKHLYIASIFFGLAAAVKWSAAFPLVGVTVFLWIFYRAQIKEKIHITLTLALYVVAIYVASYSLFLSMHGPRELVVIHQKMWHFHTVWIPENFEETAAYYVPKFDYVRDSLTNPAIWLLDKPGTYLEEATDDTVREVLFIANPLIYFPGLVFLLVSVFWWFKNYDKRLLYLTLIFASSYLPWFFFPRAVAAYYVLFGLVGLVINLAVYVELLRQKKPQLSYVYVGLVIAAFIAYYPLISYVEVSKKYLGLLTRLWGFPID